jgi:hypothetical protein
MIRVLFKFNQHNKCQLQLLQLLLTTFSMVIYYAMAKTHPHL